MELGGKAVAGEITIGNEERSWELRPAAPWAAGKYSLSLDQALEDTVGNRIGRPFEVDVFERFDQQKPPELVRVPFAVQ